MPVIIFGKLHTEVAHSRRQRLVDHFSDQRSEVILRQDGDPLAVNEQIDVAQSLPVAAVHDRFAKSSSHDAGRVGRKLIVDERVLVFGYVEALKTRLESDLGVLEAVLLVFLLAKLDALQGSFPVELIVVELDSRSGCTGFQ